jgi:hypothetical protein
VQPFIIATAKADFPFINIPFTFGAGFRQNSDYSFLYFATSFGALPCEILACLLSLNFIDQSGYHSLHIIDKGTSTTGSFSISFNCFPKIPSIPLILLNHFESYQ